MKTFAAILILAAITFAQTDPHLFLTKSDVDAMKAEWQKYPLMKKSVERAVSKMDAALAVPMDVPVPKDAGGYTHERHKQNYIEMQLAGVLYQVTGDKKYAEFVKQMLLEYAKLYPTLKEHPKKQSESPGRLFWQSLNEAVWTVYTTQAYDCINSYLTAEERKVIENNVFRKLAEFLSVERVHELDLIHNHGTWSCAAVGMLGFTLNDKDLVDKALYGSAKSGERGYLQQLNKLISPDGFYTEGAYYVRYALLPFYLFAKVLDNNRPELKIFEYRNQILKKVFYSAIQLTYTNGAFLPINDALKEKNYLSPEVILALNIAYQVYREDEYLLGIAKKQDGVILNGAGLLTAKAVASAEKIHGFKYKSVIYTDGPEGKEGGLALLRNGGNKDQSLLGFKYTSHGLSHGHYDKLSMFYYDNGNEIIQDYGAVRFINVEAKNGGRYLPETKKFAMQSIAHNTIVVDETSHFNGDISVSEKYHSDFHFGSTDNEIVKIVSAKEENAYQGVKLQRTLAMIDDKLFPKPIIVDIVKAVSAKEHQYDLPFYYLGHLMSASVEYKAYDKGRSPLGSKNGYQYLWKEAEGKGNGNFKLTWLTGDRFYSVVNNADQNTEVIFTRIGANDPSFNLRSEPGILFRRKAAGHVFASVIEPHGSFDGVNEFTSNTQGYIEKIEVMLTNDELTVVKISGKKEINWLLAITNQPSDENKKHSARIDGKDYEWKGNYKLFKNY